MQIKSILTVGLVWILLFSLGASYFGLFVPALYKENFFMFSIVTPIIVISLLIGCYSYIKAIWTSPGYPQPNLKHYYRQTLDELKSRAEQEKQYKRLRRDKKLTRNIMLQQIQNLTQNSYCEKCENVKMARTHHCKECGICIQRMDHHCPWVGNCVGKYNHKYFYLFLLYITIALLTVSISFLLDYISAQQPILTRIQKTDDSYYLVVLVTGIMCILLLFSIGFLMVGQTTILFQNLTTLESFYDDIYRHNPFDKNSIKENFKQIFGESFWFLPTQPFPGHEDEVNVAFTNQ